MCDMGEYEKSEKYLKRLLENLVNDHKDISKIDFDLGRVCYLRGDYNLALDFYTNVLRLQKQEICPDENSFDIARTLHNIANIYFDQQQISKALDFYQRALTMKQFVLMSNPDHPSISATLNNMGIVYKQEGDYNKALICYSQALQIEQTTLSADNLDLADTYHNLCSLFYDQAQYDKALEMAQAKFNILKKNFNDNHEQIKKTRES